MKYNKLTIDMVNDVLNTLDKNAYKPKTYTLFCGEKMSKLFDIEYKYAVGSITNEECYLKSFALTNNAIICDQFDYYKLPIIRKNMYTNIQTNCEYEYIENPDLNGYNDDEIKIFIRRK